MPMPFVGFSGAMTALAVPTIVFIVCNCKTPNGSFTFEPNGPGSFEIRLATYTQFAQYVIGLATGSIVLAAGSSIFMKAGALSWRFASPLMLLGASVVHGVCFIGLLVFFYEAFQHNASSYTKLRYCFIQTFGFSTLLSFAIGYVWLAAVITR